MLPKIIISVYAISMFILTTASAEVDVLSQKRELIKDLLREKLWVRSARNGELVIDKYYMNVIYSPHATTRKGTVGDVSFPKRTYLNDSDKSIEDITLPKSFCYCFPTLKPFFDGWLRGQKKNRYLGLPAYRPRRQKSYGKGEKNS